jgi:hypothetical protein
MAGLGPAIHDLNATVKEVVDARAKPGHDGGGPTVGDDAERQ